VHITCGKLGQTVTLALLIHVDIAYERRRGVAAPSSEQSVDALQVRRTIELSDTPLCS